MKGFIIGLELVDKKKKDGSPYCGIKMRWGYPKKGIIGSDIRVDWISADNELYNNFRPYVNGKLDTLINLPISIDLMPTGFVSVNLW